MIAEFYGPDDRMIAYSSVEPDARGFLPLVLYRRTNEKRHKYVLEIMPPPGRRATYSEVGIYSKEEEGK